MLARTANLEVQARHRASAARWAPRHLVASAVVRLHRRTAHALHRQRAGGRGLVVTVSTPFRTRGGRGAPGPPYKCCSGPQGRSALIDLDLGVRPSLPLRYLMLTLTQATTGRDPRPLGQRLCTILCEITPCYAANEQGLAIFPGIGGPVSHRRQHRVAHRPLPFTPVGRARRLARAGEATPLPVNHRLLRAPRAWCGTAPERAAPGRPRQHSLAPTARCA